MRKTVARWDFGSGKVRSGEGRIPELANRAVVSAMKIDDSPTKQAIRRIDADIKARSRVIAVRVNADASNLHYEQPWRRRFLDSFDPVTCTEGHGIGRGAAIYGQTVPRRASAGRWPNLLAPHATMRSSQFLFRRRRGEPEQESQNPAKKHLGLPVVGCAHGDSDKTSGSVANQAVVDGIWELTPDTLTVAMGTPSHGRWLQAAQGRSEARKAIPSGAALDDAAGVKVRLRKRLTDHRLKWSAWMLCEPGEHRRQNGQ